MIYALLALQLPNSSVPVREGLSISIVSAPLAVVRRDQVELSILNGSLLEPKAGQSVGTRVWRAAKADKDGWIQAENGYVEIDLPSDRDKTILVQPEGASFFYSGAQPYPGDVYETGYLEVPVPIKAGSNPMFFRCSRGRVRVLTREVGKPIELDTRDTTLPDIVVGDRGDAWGALVVRNSTNATVGGLSIETKSGGGKTRRTPIHAIPPFGVAKCPMRIDSPKGGALAVKLVGQGKLLDETTVTLRYRKPDETYKRTFISEIDGSVQYYGVNPARDRSPKSPKPALVLTLHGASVEGIGQADAYSGKSWATLVAPTNRRPYGFDWEDWGRLDALEVLDQAKSRLPYDPSRVYLAGHSMGGHGTWQIGALYPDLFAAIGPSAGWISSYTYAGARRPANPSPLEKLLQRANAGGDTLQYKQNYATEGVYAIHGTADDNVPITEARHMIDEIKPFHHDYFLYEQPGAGHWWDASPEPGADCVDWAPLFDFFERHALPQERSVRDVDFSTVNPQVTSKLRWLTVEAQDVEGAVSRVQIHVDAHLRKFTATTTNVARFSTGLSPIYGSGEVAYVIDGQEIKIVPGKEVDRLFLSKTGGKWAISEAEVPGEKNPARYGAFRMAFDHRMLFVYGTKGSPDENEWALAKARYDAETFWYRGNGSPDVVSDVVFAKTKFEDRNVILYGNADTNGAWAGLLGSSPVQVRRGEISIGDKKISGDGLTCLFLRPLPHSTVGFVAAVSGTGLQGMRDSNNLPYLQPMIGFPDVLVTDAKALELGLQGVRVAGFFGLDWGVPTGDFEWQN